MLRHEINRWNKGRKEETREGNSLNRNSKKKHNSQKELEDHSRGHVQRFTQIFELLNYRKNLQAFPTALGW